jgi:hypothetical protein
MENKKYYTNSKGEKVEVSTLETTHLKNAMTKKMEDLFYVESKDEFSKKLEEVNNLKEEYYKRINQFYEKLGD